LPNDDRAATCLFLRAMSAEVGPPEVAASHPRSSWSRFAAHPSRPAAASSASSVGSSGKTREVPTQRIGLSNHDNPDTLTWPKIQRLGRSEEAILVQRFDRTHGHKIAQELDHGSRGIHVARSAQRTRFQLRRPSECEGGVCCKPELGGVGSRLNCMRARFS